MTEQNLAPWKKKLPMALTISRMALSPVFVGLLLLKNPVWGWVSALLFIIASVTDYFDGYYARKYSAITNMGKFMDPIADKILVASVLIMLLPSQRIDPILVLLLLGRDILIGGVRAVAAADQVVIDAKAAGKWKTGLQMISIPMILIFDDLFGIPLYQIGYTILWISVVLSLLSGYQYIRLYLESRKDKALA